MLPLLFSPLPFPSSSSSSSYYPCPDSLCMSSGLCPLTVTLIGHHVTSATEGLCPALAHPPGMNALLAGAPALPPRLGAVLASRANSWFGGSDSYLCLSRAEGLPSPVPSHLVCDIGLASIPGPSLQMQNQRPEVAFPRRPAKAGASTPPTRHAAMSC